jgi:flagellin-like hook-associated protein FlgL
LIDDTQLRLATGLKVNSALDNPQNFFAAQSLNNRASDLTRLLDGISQSIRTIESANTGITSLTTLLDQADSIATAAREELSNSGTPEATLTGNVDLRGIKDLTALSGIVAADELAFFITDENGTAVTLSDPLGDGAGRINIAANDSIEQLITKINDITNTSDSSQALEASLTSDGFLQIKNLQGGNLRVEFEVTAGTASTALAEDLGFGKLNISERENVLASAAANRAGVTASRTAALTSAKLYDTENGSQVLARGSTLLTALENQAGASLGFTGETGDDVIISVDGGATLVDLGNIATLTIQGFVDAINENSALNTQIRAAYSETTGQVTIEQIDSSLVGIQLGARDTTNAANAAALGFGFGVEGISVADNAAVNVETESLLFGQGSAVIAGLEEDYNTVLAQIDDIVSDASYRGVNLLKGDDLTTFFNEDRSNSLLTGGVDFTSAGLGLSAANFRNETVASSAQTEVRSALLSVRAFGNTIANDLAIVNTRRDFTESTINTLESGADDLTVADQNEEGANLLALQTRQTLGVTSLSLASQSQQAVLRLF